MLNLDYLSMGKSFIHSLGNITKGVNQELIESPVSISRREHLHFSSSVLKRFGNITSWTDQTIPPTFPYALSTHIHFDLVNDKSFPFSPYGLLHKKEEIKVLRTLERGAWEMHSYIQNYRHNTTGMDFDLHSDLYIDGKLSWKSKTIAYKKLKSRRSKSNKDSAVLEGSKVLSLSSKMAREYGLISKNIDPIHMSLISAKIMGHKSSIMHGMWGLARALSEVKKFTVPYQINCSFISPMYLPCKVRMGLEEKEDIVKIGFYPDSFEKPHFLATIGKID